MSYKTKMPRSAEINTTVENYIYDYLVRNVSKDKKINRSVNFYKNVIQ